MRILTALERVAVWKEGGGSAALHRGVALAEEDVPPQLLADLRHALDTGQPAPGLGAALVHHIANPSRPAYQVMQNGKWQPVWQPGLGLSWSHTPTFAEQAAMENRVHRGTGGLSSIHEVPTLRAVVAADWTGEGGNEGATRENNRMFPEEQEVTLRRGAPLSVTGVRLLRSDGQWMELPIETTVQHPA